MVDVDKAVIAKLKAEGATFEVLVNCDNAIKLKGGDEVEMADVLASDKVFSDSGKGMLASEGRMKTVFGTEDPSEIAREIIHKGEIQLTTEYRAKLRDNKKKLILDTIQRNGVDPKTGLPHPMTRIELAIEQVKLHVDEFKPVEKQVNEVVKKLQPILPIRFEKKQIMVVIPSSYAGKGYQQVKNFGTLLKEEWLNDGSWSAIVEIPAGLQETFFDALNGLTHGEVETKILDSKQQ